MKCSTFGTELEVFDEGGASAFKNETHRPRTAVSRATNGDARSAERATCCSFCYCCEQFSMEEEGARHGPAIVAAQTQL